MASKSSTDQSRRRRISAAPSHFISSFSMKSLKNLAYLNDVLFFPFTTTKYLKKV